MTENSWEIWVEGVFSTNERDACVKIIGARLQEMDERYTEKLTELVRIRQALNIIGSRTNWRDEIAGIN